MDWREGHVRDVLVAGVVVVTILLGLYLYTGNWPPPVVVESNSMMHVDEDEYRQRFGTTRADDLGFGRLGTIDPGDLVLVKKVEAPEEIATYADGGEEHYGMAGEVIVYYRFGDRGATPIIHRATTYVERVERAGEVNYEVRWAASWDDQGTCSTRDGQRFCTFDGDDNGVTIPELNLHHKHFQWSGFITKGDNSVGNYAPDQVLGIMAEPVRMDPTASCPGGRSCNWVQGVARGELPWFGLIKLMLTNPPNKNAEVAGHPYYWSIGKMTAPQDLWIMLVVGLAVVGLAPVAIDMGFQKWKEVRAEHREESGAPPPAPPADPPDDETPADEDGPSGSHAPTRVELDLE